VGINLLREGLDLPEVSLVAIFDADKEGFLRSTRSLIQTAGRAARNINGTVILYADRVTDSMQKTIDETNRRRTMQEEYNRTHHIKPESIQKEIVDIIEREYQDESRYADLVADYGATYHTNNVSKLKEARDRIREDMLAAADNLEFEKAAILRDQMLDIEKKIEILEKAK
jgi:excinuclease ABC subunit B